MFTQMEEQRNERMLRRGLHSAFGRLYQRGCYGRWLDRFRGQTHMLLSLADTHTQHTVQTRRHGGVKLVPIAHIRGSEGRCHDFDANFRPLKEFNEERWVSIAYAQMKDVTLPLVELVEVNGAYYVRDGHHRISVARWLGQQEIEAEVTVWHSRDLNILPASSTLAVPAIKRQQQPAQGLANLMAKIGERLLTTLRKVQLRAEHTLAQGS